MAYDLTHFIPCEKYSTVLGTTELSKEWNLESLGFTIQWGNRIRESVNVHMCIKNQYLLML